MRVLFLGSPGRFSARALWGCLDAGYEICEFWYGHRTRRRAWRGDRQLGWFNPGWSVSAAIRRHHIPRLPVPPLRTATDLWLRATDLGAELIVSAAFPYVAPVELLKLVPGRAVNLHPTILPDYRGPQPLLGMLYRDEADRCGGVTLHQMVPELDAGPIIAQQRVPWNALGFRHWEADLGRATYSLVRNSLPAYLQGNIRSQPQVALGDVYFRSLDPASVVINHQRTANRAKHLLNSIGSYLALKADAAGRLWKVSKFLDIVADRPLGRPPRIGPLRIEMDLADARVTLQRWLPGTSKIRRLKTFCLFSHLNPAA